ncbi:molybdopterin molybdotransferase MoeA [Maricaulis maris]|uniref:Molybdopterin molybdenumtransferase n=1 Tax=Maricaulis maris TaxID=74318 RepID=A0A495D3I6_9PROT|nr:gephyrin-like molybdotransferase Glp [Maricaulis maris]RKQ96452.1 molybdopterin molybdochelatase [Maricaulis maris]
MIPLSDAIARVRAGLTPIEVETVGLGEAAGRVLAEAVTAGLTQPPFHASAMDGYAVRSGDLGDNPVTLPLDGESAAGHALDRPIRPGSAVRISTGAALPDGADQVVIQENTTRTGDQITLQDPPQPWRHVRASGEDFTTGQTLLEAGLRLTAPRLALAAAGGAASLRVRRQPRIGVLASGDELVAAGAPPGPGQIINSNGPALMALLNAWGAIAIDLGIARDTPSAVRTALEQARDLDLLVTIGGASVGDHDHLRRVFAEMGGTLAFDKIALKPGKPTWFGQLPGLPVLGLPGNPVSALVVAELVVRPAVERLLDETPRSRLRPVRLMVDLPGNGPRETWIRGRFDAETGRVRPSGSQDSGLISALARAELLIPRAVDAPPTRAGQMINVLLLD